MSAEKDRRGGLPATDLAGAFGRASGLQSRLGPGRGASSREETTSTDPEDRLRGEAQPLQPERQEANEAQAGSSQNDRDPRQDQQQADAADASVPAGGRAARDRRGAVVIYTSTALRTRINGYLEQTSARNADLLFDAFEATADDLPQLWADSLRSPQAQGRSLFSRDSAPQRSGVEPQIGWYVAMSPANQTVLDDLVKQITGGSSRKRSALAVLALSTYLSRWEARE